MRGVPIGQYMAAESWLPSGQWGARSFESGRWEGTGSIMPVYDPLPKASWVPWICNGEEALQPMEVLDAAVDIEWGFDITTR